MPEAAPAWEEEGAEPVEVEARAQPSSPPWSHASAAPMIELTISELNLAESKLAARKTAGRQAPGSKLKAQTKSSPAPTGPEPTRLT